MQKWSFGSGTPVGALGNFFTVHGKTKWVFQATGMEFGCTIFNFFESSE